MEIPFGVIISIGDKSNVIITDYIENEGIDLIDVISYSMKVAKLYSTGGLLITNDEFNQRTLASGGE